MNIKKSVTPASKKHGLQLIYVKELIWKTDAKIIGSFVNV